MAYEGFELLPYDYEDIANPRRTLPRALYLSVAVVALTYVVVTLAAQMLLPDQTIIAKKEVAFALVGKEALGALGLWAATLGALFSTSSAINATLFSTARLVRDVSGAGELPAAMSRERHGLPAGAVLWIAGLGAAFSLLPGITEIVSFGSLTFLLVFRPDQPAARTPYRARPLGQHPRIRRRERLLRGGRRPSLLPGPLGPRRAGADLRLRVGHRAPEERVRAVEAVRVCRTSPFAYVRLPSWWFRSQLQGRAR